MLTGESANPPGSEKDTVEANDINREVEYEEKIRQNSGFLYLGLNARIRLHNKLQSDNYPLYPTP